VDVTVKERLDKHDAEIAAIRKLIQTGMKMMVRVQELQVETRQDLRALAAAQKQTRLSLDAFIRSMN